MLKWVSAAAAVSFLAAPALAASPAEPARAALSMAGVDFRDPAATADFYARMRRAAAAVCDAYAANSRVTREEVACVETSVAVAVRRVDRPTLTAMHQGYRQTWLAAR